MRKIGLLGGTFNPVHIGHLIAAQSALEATRLDEVWLIPTSVPPHKPQPEVDSSRRLAMLEAAVADHPQLRAEPIELEREGTSYTIDTVIALQERYPADRFHWIIGSDMVHDLPNWRQIDGLLERIYFIGLERPEQPIDEAALPVSVRNRLLRAQMPLIGISSTDIRNRLKEGRSVRYLIPAEVEAYIRRNGLYES